jgi:hypothetical protein
MSASVTEIVTHVAQDDTTGRNMALLRPWAFDTNYNNLAEGERCRRLRLRPVNPEVAGSSPVEPANQCRATRGRPRPPPSLFPH